MEMEAVYKVGNGKDLARVQSYGALDKGRELGETSDGDGEGPNIEKVYVESLEAERSSP